MNTPARSSQARIGVRKKAARGSRLVTKTQAANEAMKTAPISHGSQRLRAPAAIITRKGKTM